LSKAKPTAAAAAASEFPAVELRPVASLTPYARNARTHSAKEVLELVGLVREFGWTNPILADDKGIVAGHRRQLAALKIYEEGGTIRGPGGAELPAETVPVIDCTGWSEAQRRAYILADNKSALNAGWDKDLLKVELADLDAMQFDLALTAFSAEEMAKLWDSAGGEDEDGEPPQVPASEAGDVWVLGDHRLSCGAGDLAASDAIVTGWQKASRSTARLEETGETFVEVLARRRPDALITVTPA
jgi:hypothetical protein